MVHMVPCVFLFKDLFPSALSGDDVTDESAFRFLSSGSSVATFRVGDSNVVTAAQFNLRGVCMFKQLRFVCQLVLVFIF